MVCEKKHYAGNETHPCQPSASFDASNAQLRLQHLTISQTIVTIRHRINLSNFSNKPAGDEAGGAMLFLNK